MYDQAVTSFEANVESVHRLAEFDHLVQDFVLGQLEQLNKRLREDHAIANPRLAVQQAYTQIKNIRKNDSLRPQYEYIFNQCVVLLVSYFGSALGDIFRAAVSDALTGPGGVKKLLDEKLTVSVRELAELGTDVGAKLGDLLILKNDISFQDMQSTFRTFRDYLGIEIKRDIQMNNIILGQAARHVIVHANAVANTQFMNQVRTAVPRSLKPKLVTDERLLFTPEELRSLGDSMIGFIRILSVRAASAA